MTDHIENFCTALFKCKDIYWFINRTKVFDMGDSEEKRQHNSSGYDSDIVAFNDNLKLLYECGEDKFLTNKKSGDIETFIFLTLGVT